MTQLTFEMTCPQKYLLIPTTTTATTIKIMIIKYLSLVHLAGPLKPILAVGDHLSQLLVLFHPSHKALGETACLLKRKNIFSYFFLSVSLYFSTQGETTVSHMLPGVGGKADNVEVALDEVDDHVFPHILLVLCRGVVPGRSIFSLPCSF